MNLSPGETGILDWIPIQDGAEYYVIYVNSGGTTHIYAEMYSWY